MSLQDYKMKSLADKIKGNTESLLTVGTSGDLIEVSNGEAKKVVKKGNKTKK